MSVVGLIIIVLALGIGLGSNLAIVIDIPAALFSLGGPIALLLFSGANTGAMFIRCGLLGVGLVHVLPRSSDQHWYSGRYSPG